MVIQKVAYEAPEIADLEDITGAASTGGGCMTGFYGGGFITLGFD